MKTLPYDYALLRAVHVPTGDAETVGVVLQCRQARFLGVRLLAAPEAVAARWEEVDADLLERALASVETLVAGGPEAAPIGLLPPSERFHWLTAARSTVLQPSPVRTGVAADPEAALERIAASVRRTAV
ncbi:MAG: DUF3037 domain-containing protein [Bacteroidota bacterium]